MKGIPTCPTCGKLMREVEIYLGNIWGCVDYPACHGFTVSMKGVNMRAGYLAKDEINGIKLLPVIRIKFGRYQSKDGKLILRKVKPRKGPIFWQAFELASGTVILTEDSCVKLRMKLVTSDHTPL